MTIKKRRKKSSFKPDPPKRSKAEVNPLNLLAALRDPHRVDAFCEALSRETGGAPEEQLAKLAVSTTQVAWTAEPEIARALAIEALVLDPDCFLAAMFLAERCAETVDDARLWYEQVVEICDRLDESIPDSGAYPNPVGLAYGEPYVIALCALGRIAWHDGNADLAIAYFESALDDFSEDPAWSRVFLPVAAARPSHARTIAGISLASNVARPL